LVTEIGWHLRLRHITSHHADNELIELLNMLENVILSDIPDKRFMRFGPTKNFSVKGCYHALNFRGTSIMGNSEIWSSLAPKKCKLFAWLALHNRLSTRDRFCRKVIIDQATCPFGCAEESITHILFRCPHSTSIWLKLNRQNAQRLYSLQDTITRPGLAPPTQQKE
jgi:hypothetical protein